LFVDESDLDIKLQAFQDVEKLFNKAVNDLQVMTTKTDSA
jgi:hypothetical protein